MITGLNAYKDLMEQVEAMRVQLEPRAEEIAKEVAAGKVYSVEFRKDEVAFTYNDSCNCHPEERTDTYPIEWVFAEDWRAIVDEHRETERIAAEARDAEKKRQRAAEIEQGERATMARLIEKYGAKA